MLQRRTKKEDNIHLFHILDEVSKSANVTQRSLSRRLGVALGLTNLYVKRLGKKGWIKVVNLKANRLRYELTPTGVAQKTAMALQYVQDSYVFYREARASLTKTFDGMKATGAQSVVLFGVGDLAEIALLSIQEAQLDLAGIVSLREAGQKLCGIVVESPSALGSMRYDRVVVLERDRDQAEKALGDAGVDTAVIEWVGV